MEGASLHQERGGATVLARYAFNELWSFVAGWAILLDYLILIAITAFATTDYVAVFWGELAHGAPELLLASGVIVYVAWVNIRGAGSRRWERAALVVIADLAVQLLIVVLGLGAAVRARRARRTRPRSPARRTPRSCCSRSRSRSRRSRASTPPRRWPARSRSRAAASSACSSARTAAAVPYIGIALVASSTLPQTGGRWYEAPMLGVVVGVRAGVAARAAALPGRGVRGRDPRDRLQRGDVRALAARLLARAQPPDPVAASGGCTRATTRRSC